MVGHVLNLSSEARAGITARSVTDGAVSTALLAVLMAIHCGKDLKFLDHMCLSAFSVVLSVLLLVIFLTIPRGQDRFHEGSPTDRQNTAPLIELLTFLWPRKVFKLGNLQRKDVKTLPVLPASLRTAALTEHHRRLTNRLASQGLGLVLLREYLAPLALQSILAVLQSFAVIMPNLVTYRLLERLDGEHEGATRDIMFMALLLGVSNLLPVFFTAWTMWIGSSMIDIPMRQTLGALAYQKVLTLPTIAVSPADREAQSMSTLLHINALRFEINLSYIC